MWEVSGLPEVPLEVENYVYVPVLSASSKCSIAVAIDNTSPFSVGNNRTIRRVTSDQQAFNSERKALLQTSKGDARRGLKYIRQYAQAYATTEPLIPSSYTELPSVPARHVIDI